MGLFGGKPPEIQIQLARLDAGRPEGVFYPGDRVRAEIIITSPDETKFREVRAGLMFLERYQIIDVTRDSDGDRRKTHEWKQDEHWFGKQVIATEGKFPSNFRQSYQFEWQIPGNAVPFFQGGGQSILAGHWMVKATIDRKLRGDINQEVPLHVVLPAAPRPQPGEYGENSQGSPVQMKFQLPRLDFIQGETIQGRRLLAPAQDVEPRSIKVELERVEVVVRGYERHTKVVTEQSLALASNTSLRVGSQAAYDFALTVPPKWCPTYRVESGYAVWRVQAKIDRAFKSDFNAYQTINVANGAAPAGASTATAQPFSEPQAAARSSEAFAANQSPATAPQPDFAAAMGAMSEPVAARKFCTNCGQPLPDDAAFCGNCGGKVAQA